MLTGDTIKKALEVLREAGGYFVFFDESGEEFVVARKRDFGGGNNHQNHERQLPLPTTVSLAAAVRATAERLEKTPEFILDSINREIAKYTEEQREAQLDDLSLEAAHEKPRAKKGRQVHFEPILGDLPPELQE